MRKRTELTPAQAKRQTSQKAFLLILILKERTHRGEPFLLILVENKSRKTYSAMCRITPALRTASNLSLLAFLSVTISRTLPKKS